MSKKTIVASVATGKGNKREQGFVNNFRTENAGEKKVVMVDFEGPKTSKSVRYQELEFPNYKAQTAAEALRSEVIAEFVPAD